MLKPGGRLQIADTARDAMSPECGTATSGDSWANCVSGTLEPGRLLYLLEQAGFTDLKLVGITGYSTSAETIGTLFQACKLSQSKKNS